MLMTEKQAGAVWCPLVSGRHPVHVGRIASNDSLGPASRSCIAAKCMAWRWARDPDTANLAVPLRVPGEPWTCDKCGGAGCESCDGEGKGRMLDPVGYCGLSGRPEVLW